MPLLESCRAPSQTGPGNRFTIRRLEAVLCSEHDAVRVVVGSVNPLGIPVAQLNAHHDVLNRSPLVVNQDIAVGFGFSADADAVGFRIVPVNFGHANNGIDATALIQVEAQTETTAIARDVFQIAVGVEIGVISARTIQILVGAIGVVCCGMEIDAFAQSQSNACKAGVGNGRVIVDT